MSEKILIASDSTTDLPPELVERYHIKIIPLGVTLGEKTYTDGVDIDPDAIYRHYAQTGELPKTSAVNIAEFLSFFRQYTQQGYSIVLFTISAEFSSTFNNARLAAQDFDNVFVVDTRNLCTGGGLLVVNAAEMAEQGKSAAEIALESVRLVPYVDSSFVIDSLEFLHKGGRCSAVAALGANLLHLKPCILVRNGRMTVGKKYRGKFAAVLTQYISDHLGDGTDVDPKRVFLTHAGCDSEIVDACLAQVRDILPQSEVILARAGCTISSHCGQNTLGVLFLRKTPLAQ